MTKDAQTKRLVIVESPAKARTISRFLPRGRYQVEASLGHVRDLPASAEEIPKAYLGEKWARLGVRLEQDFKPLYVVPKDKQKVVKQLKEALKGAGELYIATDEDREGESIGWHLIEVLNPTVPVRRMVFHEITEDAIREALEHTREIDRNLVEAQEARRILDRLVGYTISPVLWRKIAPKLSAGRVQSVAVRLAVLREKERIAFRKASYWDVNAELLKGERPFEAVLSHLAGVRLASGRDFDERTGKLRESLKEGKDVLLLAEADARAIAERVANRSWRVTSIEERQATRSPAAPFTTSTLQQEASRKLGLSAKETMRVAQGLYENGYITYMRTDSTHLAQEAIQGARRAVEQRYGQDYLSPSPRRYANKAKNAQEAHEAIRPAGKDFKTAQEHGLKGVEARLYDLIWKRTIATQMADARLKFVTALLEVDTPQGQATFRASGRTTLFPGFFRAYVEGSDDPDAALEDREQPLPELREGDSVECRKAEANVHETKPPARFTEASLVKLLEQEGIGRPSTYASIIDTIVQRGYIRRSGNQLVPTFTAFATNNLLERAFEKLVDTGFTAEMEEKLDVIAEGKLEPTPYLRDFYQGPDGIEARIQRALEQVDPREVATLHFPEWGEYTVRVGRYGPYVEGILEGERVTASLPEDLAPGDVTEETLAELLRLGRGEGDSLGLHPESGEPIYLKVGPYGPYLQLGGDEQAGKPKRVSLPKGLPPEQVTPELAAGLLSLPRELGHHPETGERIYAGIGRFGPYVRHGKTFASLAKDDDVLAVTLERALELLAKKTHKAGPLRVLGQHPETGEDIEVRDGKYGPYVKHGRTNASLRDDQRVDTLTLEEGLELLAAREKRKPARSVQAKRAGKGSRASAKGKTSKAGKVKKAPRKSKPKATPAQLAAHLNELDAQDAEVVRRLEGMNGQQPQAPAQVARSLELSEDEVRAAHKRGMFKLRMAYGKARKEQKEQAA